MKEIMMKAWKIAREGAQKFGGKVREYFAQALRLAWQESKNPVRPVVERIEELEKLGFRLWEKNGLSRLYINASALGLELEYYHTGNVKTAYWQGGMISNAHGRRMYAAKTYINVKDGLVYGDDKELKQAASELSGCPMAA